MNQKTQVALFSVRDLLAQLKATMIERDVEIALALVALVSRQHLFLLGAPGTGKSYLANLIGQATGGAYFERLLTKFTDPAEVFGPQDVKRFMAETVWERKVEGYLPTARTAFLDEIWKASSAILNSLLTIINERKYDNGTSRIDVLLDTVFGASNELPQDTSLGALYDRFLLRCEVLPVTSAIGQMALLEPRPAVTVKLQHLEALQEAARSVELPTEVREAMIRLRDAAWKAGISVGDRRFQQSAALVRAAAILNAREVADRSDLWPLAYSYWETPDQIETIKRLVTAERTRSAAPTTDTGQQARAASRQASRPSGAYPDFQSIMARISRASSTDNASDVALHQAIERELGLASSSRDKVQLEMWKSAIRAQNGGQWHG